MDGSQAFAAPIHILPTELLIAIFVLCASNAALAPLTLTSVSRHWRAVVNVSPRVWQLISLDAEARSLKSSRAQAELWMSKSIPLPLDVAVKAESQDLILPLLSPLLSCIERWRSFTLLGQRVECMPNINMALSPLDRLVITVGESDEDSHLNPTFASYASDSRFSMNIWLSSLPCPHALAPLRFTRISIDEIPFSSCAAQPILDFLRACPALEIFDFMSWPHGTGQIDKSTSIVSLPRLHTLHLKGTCMARTVLSFLHTPSLSKLYLTHLNVDFDYPRESTEEGDSDDEAHDFSQSPWSDQATGMGLRKLISRSNPPIRILEMDYSDMRTKDFRYVFDRLPLLRRFMIVASDMSDTVIQLLQPFLLNDEMQLRLPQLQELELHNCQRLTGHAMVDVLSGRVGYTDRVCPTNTLLEVAIVECDAFNHWHGQMLAKKLGRRLRLE